MIYAIVSSFYFSRSLSLSLSFFFLSFYLFISPTLCSMVGHHSDNCARKSVKKKTKKYNSNNNLTYYLYTYIILYINTIVLTVHTAQVLHIYNTMFTERLCGIHYREYKCVCTRLFISIDVI